MKILIVEDEAKIADYLKKGFTESGYSVEVALDGREGEYLINEGQFDLIILDIMLPGLNGWQLLEIIRRTSATPVIFLTARDAVEDKVRGLEQGADDYLAKPCDPRELTARLRAVLRRTVSSPVATPSTISVGDLQYSPARGVANINDQEDIDLTLSEGRILEALLAAPGEPIDKQQLALLALDRKLTLYDRSLDMHISNLRRKLGPHADEKPRIVALRGRGYFYSL